jgi:hypothetical protein
MKMAENIHHFRHVFKDGTAVKFTLDLTDEVPKARCHPKLAGRSDLTDEFWEWTGIISEQILPLLSHQQLFYFASVGFQNIEGFP